MDAFAELTWRGSVHQVTDPSLGDRLAAEPFTAYAGFDPTADSLHAGHLLSIMVLRRLQAAGHRPIALVGGATGMIGDPSFRDEERVLLAEEELVANSRAVRTQLARLLDIAEGQVVDNRSWLGPMTVVELLRDVGKHFSVNAMLAKDSVRSRLSGRDQGISYTEFSYQVLQAFDFLHLFDAQGCRLQVGGSDQWGNITAGVDLIRRVRGGTAYGITTPLLTRADGAKFSKSEPDNPWLDARRTSPFRFYQFWMRASDEDVGPWLRLLTDLPRGRIEELEASVARRPERREAQTVLAAHLTTWVHGGSAAGRAKAASDVLYGTGSIRSLDEATLLEVFADAPSSVRPRAYLDAPGYPLVDLLAEVGLLASKAAARTAITQGGVYLNNLREENVDHRLSQGDLLSGGVVLLRRGKRDYHLVRFA